MNPTSNVSQTLAEVLVTTSMDQQLHSATGPASLTVSQVHRYASSSNTSKTQSTEALITPATCDPITSYTLGHDREALERQRRCGAEGIILRPMCVLMNLRRLLVRLRGGYDVVTWPGTASYPGDLDGVLRVKLAPHLDSFFVVLQLEALHVHQAIAQLLEHFGGAWNNGRKLCRPGGEPRRVTTATKGSHPRDTTPSSMSKRCLPRLCCRPWWRASSLVPILCHPRGQSTEALQLQSAPAMGR